MQRRKSWTAEQWKSFTAEYAENAERRRDLWRCVEVRSARKRSRDAPSVLFVHACGKVQVEGVPLRPASSAPLW